MTIPPGTMYAGRFLVLRSLGSTGLAHLYAAQDTEAQKPVTLKVVPRCHEVDSMAVRRFEREVRALLAVDSSTISRYLDKLETPDSVALVTERLEGMDLRSYMTLYGELSLDSALSIALQTARGLHACHLAGVVHRDLRPENVLIAVDETVKVVNFAMVGIQDATTLTMTGTMFGEPEYSAPETFANAPLDVRIDIYSLGVVLWEMVVGESPFRGRGIAEILREKSAREVSRASAHNVLVPEWLDDLIAAMTAREPDGRPSSLGQVIRSLEQRQRIALEGSARGRCTACGQRALRGIDFCSFCGVSRTAEGQKPESSVCVLTGVADRPATVRFLHKAFSVEPQKDLGGAVKKLPVSLVEGVTAAQCRWLVDALEKLKCVVEIRPHVEWYFKQCSVTMTIVLMMYLVFFSDSEGFMPQARVPQTIVGTAIYFFGKLAFIGICVLVIRLYLKRGGLKAQDQPKLWFAGVRAFILKGKERGDTLTVISRVLLLLMLVGAMLLFASMVQSVVLIVLRSFDIVYYARFVFGSDRSVFSLVGPLLMASLIPVGILLLMTRLMGRFARAPLFRPEAADPRARRVLREPRDVRALAGLKALIQKTGTDDLRFIISNALESYLVFMRIKERMGVLPACALRDLKERIAGAIETISSTGEDLLELGERASPDVRNSLERSVLRLRRKVAEQDGADDGSAAELLGDAEEQIILWEADFELLHRKLNALRIVGGETRAAVAQLVAIATDTSDEERVMRELNLFSETLQTLEQAL